MRVGSWNLNHRGRAATREQGALVRDRGVELLLVQEANPASLDVLVEAAGLVWVVTPTGIWPGEPTVGRQPLAAVAGRTPISCGPTATPVTGGSTARAATT